MGKTLIESNQKIYDYYKSVFFENQRHCGTMYSKFLISGYYSVNVILIAPVSVSTWQVFNILLNSHVSLLAPVCALYICLCVCV